MYVIEKGIPIPPKQAGRPPQNKYPFKKMKVGHSFAVPVNGQGYQKVQSAVSGNASNITKKTGAKFSTRFDKEAKAVRIWRVA
jgi:hypothetical protein